MKPWFWLSLAVFLSTSLLGVIDDDPPRLVVWAGVVQFAISVPLGINYRLSDRKKAQQESISKKQNAQKE